MLASRRLTFADTRVSSIKQDTGDRGWVPAWFIGKLSSGSGSGTESQPSSAATPTGPAPHHLDFASSAEVAEEIHGIEGYSVDR